MNVSQSQLDAVQVQQQIAFAVAKKGQQAQKAEGEAVLKLLDQAMQTQRQTADQVQARPTASPIPPGGLDVTA